MELRVGKDAFSGTTWRMCALPRSAEHAQEEEGAVVSTPSTPAVQIGVKRAAGGNSINQPQVCWCWLMAVRANQKAIVPPAVANFPETPKPGISRSGVFEFGQF